MSLTFVGRAVISLSLAVVVQLAPVVSALAATTPDSTTVAVQNFDELARPTDAVVDSIGVNTHLHYDDTSYGRFDDIVIPRLRELGVRHVRDGAYTYDGISGSSFYYQRLRQLASLGIHFDLITSLDSPWSKGTDYTKLAQLQAWSGGAVEALEGVNEPDLRGSEGWPAEVRSATAELAETVRSAPSLAGVQVLAPAITSPSGAAELGSLASDVDAANMHNYLGDHVPETSGWGDGGYGSLWWNSTQIASVVAPGKPVISTETGYQTAVGSTNGVSETSAATYLPRQVLTSFAAGVDRTYLYELMRERQDTSDPEASFGLVKADGTPTPSFEVLKSLIQNLADDGPEFAPSRFAWGVSGSLDGLQHVLLQRSNGDFVLALWTSQSVWDQTTQDDVAATARTVSLTLPTGYQIDGTTMLNPGGAVVTAGGSSRDVQVGASVNLVEIKASPGAAPSDPDGTAASPGQGTPPRPEPMTSVPPALSVPPTKLSGPWAMVDRAGDTRGHGTTVRAWRSMSDLREGTLSVVGGHLVVHVVLENAPSRGRGAQLVLRLMGRGPDGSRLRLVSVRNRVRLSITRNGSSRPVSCGPVTTSSAARTFQLDLPISCLPTTPITLRVQTSVGHAGDGPMWTDSMAGPRVSPALS